MARPPRMMGREHTLELLLGADDIQGDLAVYGIVSGSLTDADLGRLWSPSQCASRRSMYKQSARPSASRRWAVCRLNSKSHLRRCVHCLDAPVGRKNTASGS